MGQGSDNSSDAQSRLAWSNRMTLILSVLGLGSAMARTRHCQDTFSQSCVSPVTHKARLNSPQPNPTSNPWNHLCLRSDFKVQLPMPGR